MREQAFSSHSSSPTRAADVVRMQRAACAGPNDESSGLRSISSFLPQLAAREIRAPPHPPEFFPHHRVVHLGPIESLRGKSTVGGGDHAVATDQVGKAQDALANKFRMLNDIARVGDHAGAEHLAVGNLDVLEQMILVLMAWI